jgi:hypothetical protein
MAVVADASALGALAKVSWKIDNCPHVVCPGSWTFKTDIFLEEPEWGQVNCRQESVAIDRIFPATGSINN